MRPLVKLVGGLVFGVSVIAIVLVAGMRTKSPRVLNVVRRIQRTMKPVALRGAGTPGAYASVIRHVGRTTGRRYETPVVAVPTDDGFVIALPYGLNTDWLKNVLASGSAIVVDEGTTYEVDQPQIVPAASAAPLFPRENQRTHRLFGVEECLLVRRAEPNEAAEKLPTPPDA